MSNYADLPLLRILLLGTVAVMELQSETTLVKDTSYIPEGMICTGISQCGRLSEIPVQVRMGGM